MSTITLWLAFYFVLFSEYTFLLLLVIQLQVEYKIEYARIFHFGFFLFNRLFMSIPFVLGKREGEKENTN